jgi:hypothetical protein
VLVERLGEATQPTAANLTAGREIFEQAWQSRNFKLSGPGWDTKERVAWLHLALWKNPSKALPRFHDITFIYGPKPAGVKEDGRWDPGTRTLTLYYGVFDTDAQRSGTFPYAVFVIQHEPGHALEMTFDQSALPEFGKTLRADGKVPVTRLRAQGRPRELRRGLRVVDARPRRAQCAAAHGRRAVQLAIRLAMNAARNGGCLTGEWRAPLPGRCRPHSGGRRARAG